MKQNHVFFLLGVVALTVSGCSSGKGGHGGRTSTSESTTVTSSQSETSATSTISSTSQQSGDDPEGYPNYSAHYRNKIDCFGNPVADYMFWDNYGEDLIEQVHYYLVDQHTKYLKYQSYPNANYGPYFRECDKDPVSGQTIQFYTGKLGSPQSREHVWPCANSSDLWYRDSTKYEHAIDNGYDYWGGGSDIYNLHSIVSATNTSRGNAAFVVFKDSERSSLKSITDGGPYKLYVNQTGNKCEPAKEYRGNIARIVMYMWCHYRLIGNRNAYYPKDYSVDLNYGKAVYNRSEAVETTENHTPDMFGPLDLKKIIGYNTNQEIYDALRQWNHDDPPDETEEYANNYIEANLQGNRNPFVDYPHLVDNILEWLED